MADAPIVVELGSTSSKRVRQLKRGSGKLNDEIQEVITQMSTRLGDEAESKTLVPVVVVYRQKSKSARRSLLDLLL